MKTYKSTNPLRQYLTKIVELFSEYGYEVDNVEEPEEGVRPVIMLEVSGFTYSETFDDALTKIAHDESLIIEDTDSSDGTKTIWWIEEL